MSKFIEIPYATSWGRREGDATILSLDPNGDLKVENRTSDEGSTVNYLPLTAVLDALIKLGVKFPEPKPFDPRLKEAYLGVSGDVWIVTRAFGGVRMTRGRGRLTAAEALEADGPFTRIYPEDAS